MQRIVEEKGPAGRRRPWLPALPAFLCLVALHCGSHPAERRGSIYSLKSDPTEDNVRQIRDWLDDPNRDVRATALNALVELEVADAAQLALDGLRDGDGFVRATAAKLLGDLGSAESAETLDDVLLEDPDPIARQRAAEALTRLGGSAAVAALTRALADPIERVRRAAVNGVRELDPAFARDELIQLLHSDSVWEIRALVAHALGLTGDPDVLPELEKARDDPNEFVRSAVSNALSVHERVRGRRAGVGAE